MAKRYLDIMNAFNNIVYSKNTVEFVTVAVQYCEYLENLYGVSLPDFTDRMTKLAPLLYLKATLLPGTEMLDDTMQEAVVSEEDYNYIISKIYDITGKDDTYLEVFLDDMKYSDTPISANISEDLADIYQDVKNFISIYERGIEDNMNDALYICCENFKSYWGQKLLNVLRALHALRYSNIIEESEDSELNSFETW